MHTKLPKRTVVLLGVGHTNAHIVRMWRMKPIDDAQLICVSNRWKASYSGMLPGVLAGQYSNDRMDIDLARFCASANARLIVDDVTGLDGNERCLKFANRPDLPFDVLSIGIGSVPNRGEVVDDGSILPIKPMQTFLSRLQETVAKHSQEKKSQPIKIAVVGAGAGGTEIAFCLPHRLKLWFPNQDFEFKLVTSHAHVASGCLPSTVRLVERELDQVGIEYLSERRVTKVQGGRMEFHGHESIDVDVAIWATGASAPPLLSKLDLPTDDRGFLRIENNLQVVGQEHVFAVGDTGTLESGPTPKAGVYAVRQGPILWQNIGRALQRQTLVPFRPQRDFLTLLNFGDGRAIAQFKGRAFRGKWCWKLKDYIDSKFMDKYQDYTPMEMKPEPPDPELQMRCTGCGGKVGGSVLSRVLSRLDVPQSEHVIVGLEQPDDAAVVQIAGGRPVTATADFFTAPLDDPYVVGRLAALNSASDVFAIGAKPVAALALVTIPFGSPRRQEQVLYETLAGSLHEFRQMDCSLVGGHTIEGPTLTVGYTVLADQGDDQPQTKGRLRTGDQLILTKPLGSGILLAGHMQALCKADWLAVLLDTMLLSNQLAMEAVSTIEIPAVTDVTGFGFAGHLLEMLKASNMSANIDLQNVPLMPGTDALLEKGIESTLAPANKDVEASFRVSESHRQQAEYKALFDPQTCGGILMGVAPNDVATVLARLSDQSDVPSVVVGEVVQSTDGASEIVIDGRGR